MQEEYSKRVGTYKITKKLLGQGSFSQVFLGYSHQRHRIAVKIIPRHQLEPSESNKLQKQAIILRSLKHENIVQLLDVKKSHQNLYLFLQYCQGGNLAQYLSKHRKIPQKEAMKIFKQILLGVSSMHQYKIVHRDLKPDNILFKNGRIKISDFGLARNYSQHQMMKTYVGTPFNMAPEILKGNYYSHKVDIYSAATILYQMLYGSVPYKARDYKTLLEAIENNRCSLENAEVSQETKIMLKEMLAPKPEDRMELYQALDIITKYESEQIGKRIDELRRINHKNRDNFAVPGGNSCGFDLGLLRGGPSDLDQRLSIRLVQKLTAQA